MVHSFPNPDTAQEILQKSSEIAMSEVLRIGKIAETYKVTGSPLHTRSGTVFKIMYFYGVWSPYLIREDNSIIEPFSWGYEQRMEFLEYRQSLLDEYADVVTSTYKVAETAISGLLR